MNLLQMCNTTWFWAFRWL